MIRRFVIKMCSFLVIVAGIACYQYQAGIWSEKEEENRLEAAEIEEYNQKILEGEGKAASLYKDGTYKAASKGFGGEIEVETTVKDGRIYSVDIVKAEKEDGAYLNAAAKIIDNIINKQSADVDTISGATYSSTGIRDAVNKTLEEASN